MENFFGADSFVIKNDFVSCHITEECAMNLIEFNVEGKSFSPFFIPPWWNEKQDNTTALRRNLRGTFFCLPMGSSPKSKDSEEQVPVHGFSAHNKWTMISNTDCDVALEYKKDKLCIHKDILLSKTNNVVYEKNYVSGYNGNSPVGFHPTIKLPAGGASILAGGMKDVFTTPQFTESPAKGGYCLFKSNKVYDSLDKIETIYGDTENLNDMPIREGFEDLVMIGEDCSQDFGYTAVTYKEEKIVYFQLKNVKKLPLTMFWISNGGRYYEPWNGRCKSVLGIEECASYFLYGSEKSSALNMISEKGYKTAVEMQDDKTYTFEMIYGAVKLDNDFGKVEKIVKSEKGVSIIGSNGKSIEVEVNLGYLE